MSKRLKQLRLAKGLSLDELAQAMGHVVSKQALSKFERGVSRPSPRVLGEIATGLGVKVAHITQPSSLEMDFKGFRKHSRMRVAEQDQIKSVVAEEAEKRWKVLQLSGYADRISSLPVWSVKTLQDCERVAHEMRAFWNLGTDPLGEITSLLESHGILVLRVPSEAPFDGLAYTARISGTDKTFPVIATRKGIPGERQRLNLTHELGHLIAKVKGLSEEKAAFRIGAAILAPAKILREDVGQRRHSINFYELLVLKRRYGMSLQALLYRLHDLGVITESHYRSWNIHINRLGFKKREPDELPEERSTWLELHVLQLLEEDVISKAEASYMLGRDTDEYRPTQRRSFIKRQDLLKLPLREQREILAAEAESLKSHYEKDTETQEWLEADLTHDDDDE